MANFSAIARPYAQAAYEFAQAQQALPLWEELLRTAAETVQLPALASLLSNDRISAKQWFSLLSDILKSSVSAQVQQTNENWKNFLRLVSENKRVSILPQIYALFKEYKALHNHVSVVEVTTAIPLAAKQQQKLTDKLSKRLHYPVTLRCTVDENIVGGALVRAGDKVIDGSVRGQLTRLLEFVIR
jgi:F-type H+-transporting ATPase subunit delta